MRGEPKISDHGALGITTAIDSTSMFRYGILCWLVVAEAFMPLFLTTIATDTVPSTSSNTSKSL